MTAPILALGLFVALFALATLRGLHLGLLMFVAACAAGPLLAGMTLREVMAGFPVGIFMLVVGVTWFFGIAHLNGATARVIDALLARTGGRRGTVPVMFFGLSAVAAAMGAPQGGLATGPLGMAAARTAGVDAALIAVALNSGISAGAFAPTSLFGIITYRVAREAGIDVSPLVLLAAAVAANLVLLLAAMAIFGRGEAARRAGLQPCQEAALKSCPTEEERARGADDVRRAGLQPCQEATVTSRPTAPQRVTLVCLVLLVPGFVAATLAGLDPDIGIVLLSLGALLAAIDPAVGRQALGRIDWSTAMIVSGIVTYVAVLQRLDAVNLLGRGAMAIGTPLVAALVICMIAALVSAFASTTAVLAALVPMAVPLATSGAVPGWALITTLGVSATVVDCSPFSNTGATLIASAAEDERPRLRQVLLRWSLAMVLAGPLLLLPVLLVLF
ncbi:MAG: SLC13 family permease [Vicinamibacterales bacterium]